MKRSLFFIGLSLVTFFSQAQAPEKIVRPFIRSVKLFKAGDQTTSPVLHLGQSEQLELHFDDTEGTLKAYYYTLQLCNADWTEARLPAFDYLKGFITQRIQNYRVSSGVQTRYMHYQALLPERNSGPTRGG
ncbi:MAG: type IX secretion system plug protein domain-containing protein, partial [Sphingomonadales bacterium]